MRILAILVLLFGAALAGGGIYYASVYMEMYKLGLEGENSGPKTERIIVAKSGLRYGHRLKPGDLRWVDWPKTSLPEGAFTSREELFGKQGEEPRIVLRAIEKGEPLLQTKLSGFGASTRLAAQLPEGKRAYTVPIDMTGGGSFINPGDRVDVVLTKSDEGELLSGIIMQDILVIAVDRNLDQELNRAGGGSTATIEVSTRQAQELIVAQRVGSLTLMLRGVHEISTGKLDPVEASDLDFGIEKPTLEKPDFGTMVRVRRGTSLGTQKVDDSPEVLADKRRQLEEEQARVAEEIKRLEEQEQQAN